jgi:hypothetical protein
MSCILKSIHKALLLEHLNTCISPVCDLQVSPGSWYFIASPRVNLVSHTIQRFILVFSNFSLGHKRLRNAATLIACMAGETTLAVGLIFHLCTSMESKRDSTYRPPHDPASEAPFATGTEYHRLCPAYPVCPFLETACAPTIVDIRGMESQTVFFPASPSARREIEVDHSILLQMCSTLYKALVSSQAFLHFKHNQSLQHTD